MRIYLVRHGQAQPPGSDRLRRLTPRGEKDTRKLADNIAAIGIKVAAIWHSGEPRAKQTAEILSTAVESYHGLQNRKGLTPDADPFKARSVFERLDEDIMIVSHLPFLGKLAGLMLTQAPEAHTNTEDEEATAKAKVTKSLAGVTRWLDKRAQNLATPQEGPAIPDIIAFRHSSIVCLERRAAGHWKIAWMALPDATPSADDAETQTEPSRPSRFRANSSLTSDEVRQNARTSSRPTARQSQAPERTALEIEPIDDLEANIGQRIEHTHTPNSYTDITKPKNPDEGDDDDLFDLEPEK